ncbi:hypothetical protein HYZ97_04620 [Candidatus Pacearchaeota archaeon]|nr:hypothetical protein [Candidatus Pacearchaeota archaeon]
MKQKELIRAEPGASLVQNELTAISKTYTFKKLRAQPAVRFLVGFKYQKLSLLVLIIIATYFLFSNPAMQENIRALQELSYIGIFLAGLLFSFGFTTPFAVGFFILLNPPNIILASLIGGVGALIADLFIFNFIRVSFMDEFIQLKKEHRLRRILSNVRIRIKTRLKLYLIYFCAGFLIASPLPDELGVALLAGLTSIKPSRLALISFICNTLGIFIILLLST